MLQGGIFKEASLRGSKGTFGSWCSTRERERSEILIPADINGCVTQFVRKGQPVAINGAWLQFPVLEQIQQEVSNGLNRGCPEVHLITEASLCQNGPLCLLD